jgi:hypothetical protein
MGAVCPLAAHHGAESCLLGAVTAIASIAGMMLRCGNEVKGHCTKSLRDSWVHGLAAEH